MNATGFQGVGKPTHLGEQFFVVKVSKKNPNRPIAELSTIERLLERIRTQNKRKIFEYFADVLRTYEIDLIGQQRILVQQISSVLLDMYLGERNWHKLLSCCQLTASLLKDAWQFAEKSTEDASLKRAIKSVTMQLQDALTEVKNVVLLELNEVLTKEQEEMNVDPKATDLQSVDQLVAINGYLREALAHINSYVDSN